MDGRMFYMNDTITINTSIYIVYAMNQKEIQVRECQHCGVNVATTYLPWTMDPKGKYFLCEECCEWEIESQ
jgi:hypothetical protein